MRCIPSPCLIVGAYLTVRPVPTRTIITNSELTFRFLLTATVANFHHRSLPMLSMYVALIIRRAPLRHCCVDHSSNLVLGILVYVPEAEGVYPPARPNAQGDGAGRRPPPAESPHTPTPPRHCTTAPPHIYRALHAARGCACAAGHATHVRRTSALSHERERSVHHYSVAHSRPHASSSSSSSSSSSPISSARAASFIDILVFPASIAASEASW